MKKLLLLLVFIFHTSAHAQNLESTANTLSIDEKASATASWKIGETVTTMTHWVVGKDDPAKDIEYPGYRVFLGITSDGYYAVQDFYENGNKYNDPYQLTRQSAVLNNGPDWHTALQGALVLYYPTGEKMVEKYSTNGHAAKETNIWFPSGQLSAQTRYLLTGNIYTAYHPNGQKAIQRQYNMKGQIIDMQEWDENGNLKK